MTATPWPRRGLIALAAGSGLAASLRARPALAQPSPEKRAAMLEAMMAALHAARDEAEAAAIEARIRGVWLEATSPAVRLLMARGIRDLRAGAGADAERVFDDVIVLDPNLAEAYVQRGLARLKQGDRRGAVADLEEGLRREPRHFDAIRALADIAAERGDYASAYAGWQRLLAIDPLAPGGAARLKELRRRALGENA